MKETLTAHCDKCGAKPAEGEHLVFVQEPVSERVARVRWVCKACKRKLAQPEPPRAA